MPGKRFIILEERRALQSRFSISSLGVKHLRGDVLLLAPKPQISAPQAVARLGGPGPRAVRSHMKPRTFSKLMVAAAAAATVLTALNVALNDRIPSDDRNCEVHGICEIRFRNVHTESPFEVTTLKLNRTRSTHCAYIMPRTVRFADV